MRRKNMKKRLLSALLGVTMAAGLLTGCGSSDTKETTTTADGKIQIDFWYSGGKTAVNVFQDIVDEFNASQDTYEIKTTTQADYTETYEKLQAGIAGKKGAGYGAAGCRQIQKSFGEKSGGRYQ